MSPIAFVLFLAGASAVSAGIAPIVTVGQSYAAHAIDHSIQSHIIPAAPLVAPAPARLVAAAAPVVAPAPVVAAPARYVATTNYIAAPAALPVAAPARLTASYVAHPATYVF